MKHKFPLLTSEVAMLLIVVLLGWASYQVYNIVRLVERSSTGFQETERILRIYGALRLKEEYLTIAFDLEQEVKALHRTLEELVKPKERAEQSELKRQFDLKSQDLRNLIYRQKDRAKRTALRQKPTIGNSKAGNEDQEFTANEMINSLSRVEGLFESVDRTYSSYLTHAKAIGHYTGGLHLRDAPVEKELTNAERERDLLLALASQIGAEGESIRLPRQTPQAGLRQEKLQPLLVALIFALIVLCLLLVFAVYRQRVVAPLRLKIHQEEVMVEHQRKLEHFALFAKDLVHEIRNPLTSMNARLYTLQSKLAKGSVEHNDALVIGSEINRLDHILKDFQRLARPPEPHLVPIKVDALLREAQELMEPLLKQQSIELKRELAHDVELFADPQQLKQVLINLIKNAAESIKHDGTITLRGRSDRPQVKGQQSERVVIEVEDNGPGIPLEIQESMFDPFFSTKGTGTGLGLPIVARIVKKHGGALKFESKGDHGAIFRVELPKQKEVA